VGRKTAEGKRKTMNEEEINQKIIEVSYIICSKQMIDIEESDFLHAIWRLQGHLDVLFQLRDELRQTITRATAKQGEMK